ncbi:hypothetical protein, partial [Tropicimonas sp.]|uniref:hypothetical protein n=1 Tax=Tropicimonas sp. TaxID=2067044 RepID=UPI003A89BAD1
MTQYIAALAERPAEDTVLFARPGAGHATGANTATVQGTYNYAKEGNTLRLFPDEMRLCLRPRAIAGGQITCGLMVANGGISNLSSGEVFADGWLTGGTAHVYRMAGGRLTEVASGAITACAARSVVALTGSGHATATEWRWSPGMYFRP